MNPSKTFVLFVFFWVICETECNVNLCATGGSFPLSYNSVNFEECDCQTTCIRTCCKPGYNFEHLRCKFDKSAKLLISVYTNKTDFVGTTDKGVSIGILECESVYKLNRSDPQDEVYVQEDGSLWYPSVKSFFPNDKYCISGSGQNNVIFLCVDTSTENVSMYVGMIISMPFLLATFLVYSLIQPKNLLHRAVMFYVLTLLIAYGILVMVQLRGFIENKQCITLGYLLEFFFLVSFCWMNIICVDIWLSSRPLLRVSSERKMFFLSCAYAWGLPTTFVLVTFLMSKIVNHDSKYHPQIGYTTCFVGGGYPTLIYFYGPIFVLITVNLVLFVMTVMEMQKLKKLRSSTYVNQIKFCLYVKLIFAMGLNWIVDVISWFVDWQTDGKVPTEIWFLSDLFNALYGVIIFILFVTQDNILKALKDRFKKKKFRMENSTILDNVTETMISK